MRENRETSTTIFTLFQDLIEKVNKNKPFPTYLVDGVGSAGAESSGALGLLGQNSSWEWELDVGVVHLLVLGSSALVGLDLLGAEDLDGAWSSSMSAGHLSVHLGDGEWEAHVSVLSVHVLAGGSRVVSDPDTVVLDAARVALVHLGALDDLSDLLVDLLVVREKLPESRLGGHRVWSKDLLLEQLGVWLHGARKLSADDSVLFEVTLALHVL